MADFKDRDQFVEHSHLEGDPMYEITKFVLAATSKLQKKVRYLEAELKMQLENCQCMTDASQGKAQRKFRNAMVNSQGGKRYKAETDSGKCEDSNLRLKTYADVVKREFRVAQNVEKRYSKNDFKDVRSRSNTCNEDKSQNSSKLKTCKFCGTVHVWGKERCAAYGNKCSI